MRMKTRDMVSTLLAVPDSAAAFLALVQNECLAARSKHRPYANDHEAFGVLAEELDEFREWVWMKRRDREPASMLGELVQVAACARMAACEVHGVASEDFDRRVGDQVAQARAGGRRVNSAHEGWARITKATDGWRHRLGHVRPAARLDVGAAQPAGQTVDDLVDVAAWSALTAADVGLIEATRSGT